jgi:ribosomal-protein-alanine N-acetyltransferase
MMTNRLILRKFVYDDWPALYALVSDPQVCHHVPFNPLSEEETRETVQVLVDGRQANPPRYDFALVLRSDETLIGQCFLVMRYDEKRQAEIGFVLNRHYWGCGYATEAARAVPRYGFHKLNLHRIYATYRPANVASARVLEKLAMRREGHLRRHRWMKGAWHDSYLYAILEDEWKLANPQPDPG